VMSVWTTLPVTGPARTQGRKDARTPDGHRLEAGDDPLAHVGIHAKRRRFSARSSGHHEDPGGARCASPGSRSFIAPTSWSAGGRRTGTQCLRLLPRQAPSRDQGADVTHFRPAIGTDARVLTFRAGAAVQAHAVYTPGTTWPILGHLTGSFREISQAPRFRCHCWNHDASTATASGSPPVALVCLPGPHLTPLG
jgi:hypothetical protein